MATDINEIIKKAMIPAGKTRLEYISNDLEEIDRKKFGKILHRYFDNHKRDGKLDEIEQRRVFLVFGEKITKEKLYLFQSTIDNADILIQKITDGKTPLDIRVKTIKGLGIVVPISQKVVDALKITLKDTNWLVRKESATALGKGKENSKTAVTDLTNALDDEKWQVRLQASEALGEIGYYAEEAVGSLTDRLADIKWEVQEVAAYALGMIGSEEVIDRLIEVYNKPNTKPRVQVEIIIALGEIETQPKSMINNKTMDFLQSVLDDANTDAYCYARAKFWLDKIKKLISK